MSYDQVEQLLRAGWSNRAIARHVGLNTRRIAPIRAELGLPKHPPGPAAAPSLAEAFRARTRRTDDGHLEWDGHIDQGLPRLDWGGHRYSARRLAYRIRTGRDPQGKALPGCGHHGCVEPAHMEDARDRAQYTAIFGRIL